MTSPRSEAAYPVSDGFLDFPKKKNVEREKSGENQRGQDTGDAVSVDVVRCKRRGRDRPERQVAPPPRGWLVAGSFLSPSPLHVPALHAPGSAATRRVNVVTSRSLRRHGGRLDGSLTANLLAVFCHQPAGARRHGVWALVVLVLEISGPVSVSSASPVDAGRALRRPAGPSASAWQGRSARPAGA
jgi:hypothetical protein